MSPFGGRGLFLGFVLSVALLSGCGTNTVFDYSVPDVPDERYSLPSLRQEARETAKAYRKRASNLASTTQIFDDLTMAGGGATVAGTLTRASLPELQLLSAGTAAVFLTGNYYNPKARSAIYMDGASAMYCLGTLAGQASYHFQKRSRAQILLAYQNTPPAQKQILLPVLEFYTHAVLKLSEAIDAVNSKVLSRSTSASQLQDMSALRSQLLSQAQDAVTKQAAFRAAVDAAANQGKAPKVAPAVHDDPSESPPPARSEAARTDKAKLNTVELVLDLKVPTASAIQPQIDFVAAFDTALTACIAKAG